MDTDVLRPKREGFSDTRSLFFGDRIGLRGPSNGAIAILEVVIDRSDALEIIPGECRVDVVFESFWDAASAWVIVRSDQIQRVDFRIDARGQQQARQGYILRSDRSEVRRCIERGTQADQGDRRVVDHAVAHDGIAVATGFESDGHQGRRDRRDVHRIGDFVGRHIRTDHVDDNHSADAGDRWGTTRERIDKRDLQSRTVLSESLGGKPKLDGSVGVQIRDRRCSRFIPHWGKRGGLTGAYPESETACRNEWAWEQIDIRGEPQCGGVGRGVVGHSLGLERDIVGIADGVCRVEQLVEVRILSAAYGGVAERIVFHEEFFVIEVNDNRIAALFENARDVANHRLRNHCSDLGTKIDAEFKCVLTRVRIARNKQIAGGIAQSGDASERVVKSEDFQSIVIVGKVLGEAQGDFVFVRAIPDDDRTWNDDHIIAPGKQNRRVTNRIDRP